MRKTNLIKSIVCGLMLTAVVGTTAFAGSYSDEEYVFRDTSVRRDYTGSVGIYSGVGTETTAYTVAVNNTYASRLYKAQYAKFDNFSDQYVEHVTDSKVLSYYQTVSAVGGRVCNDAFSSYALTAYGYNSTAEATGQADYFRYYLEQCNE